MVAARSAIHVLAGMLDAVRAVFRARDIGKVRPVPWSRRPPEYKATIVVESVVAVLIATWAALRAPSWWVPSPGRTVEVAVLLGILTISPFVQVPVVTYKRGGTWFSTTSPYYFGAAALLVAHGPAMLAAAVSTAGSFASIWVRRARSLSLGIANSAMDIPSFVAAKLVYDAVLSASGFPSAPVLGGVLVVLTLDLIQHLIMAVHSAAGGYMSLTRAVVEHCFNVHVWVMRAVQGLAVGLALAAPGVPGVWAALASGIVMHVLLERIGRTRHAVAAGSSCPLTGLVTHASFQAELREVLRGHAPVGLLMVDIDYFKQLNDARGHLEGDRVLREVAGAIVSCISIADTASRYGGEEFAVIVPGADREVISVIGERIRGEVEARCGVTVSVGGAVAVPGADAASLVEAADAALYASKAAGRNRVTVVPEPVEKREGAGPVVAVQEVGRR